MSLENSKKSDFAALNNAIAGASALMVAFFKIYIRNFLVGERYTKTISEAPWMDRE